MSTNCVDCVCNKRTKTDLLCDDCRIKRAARDLLAACRAVVDSRLLVHERTDDDGEVGRLVRAAIAKAEGSDARTAD